MYVINLQMKKLACIISLIILSYSQLFTQSTSQCLGCAKVIYIVDNSGSVNGSEFPDMKSSIDAISANILSTYSNVEIAVVQYAYPSGTNNSYQVTVPFTSNLATVQTWSRAWTFGNDHLPGSFEAMRAANLWGTGSQLDLVTGGCAIKFFVFTDAMKESTGSCLKNSPAAQAGANASTFPDYGEYNWLKTTYGADFTVYHVDPGFGAPAAPAGGAISSVGGSYATAIDPNPGDPDGSGVLPRKYTNSNNFLLTAAQINAIVLNIDPASTGSLNFTIGFSNSDTICLGDVTNFSSTAQPPIQYSSWDFGDGSPLVTNTLNVSHTYASTGTYTVTHIVHLDSVCKDTAIRIVEVAPHVNAAFTIDTVCFGNDNTIVNSSTGTISNTSWDFGDGNTGSQTTPLFTHTYAASGTYNVELIVENSFGCADTANAVAGVDEMPVPDFTFTNQCLGTPYQFTNTTTLGNPSNTSGVFWLWYLGNSTTSIQEDPTANYSTDGFKNVRLVATSPGGCVADITKQIEVYPIPVADFDADTVCYGELTSFTDLSTVTSGSINSWLWLTDSVYTSQNPTHLYDNDGTHNVRLIVTTNNGCKDTVAKPVIVHPVPTADFSYAPINLSLFNTDACFTNKSIQADSYLWDFDFDNQTSVSTDPCIQFPIGVMNDYNVKLIAYNNFGCVDSTIIEVPVGDEFLLYVPNAFTPDSDGLNEDFIPTYSGITELKFYIFNRWGDLLFSTEEQDKGWDGTYKGLKVKQDVYVYRIVARDIYGNRHNEIGHFSLLR